MGIVQTGGRGEANSRRRRVRKPRESLQETALEGHPGFRLQTREFHLSVGAVLCQLRIQIETEPPVFIVATCQYLQSAVDVWERADYRGGNRCFPPCA